MGANGTYLSSAPLAERELSPRALSDDLISSYYVEGCMEGCMRDYMIKYFPLTPGDHPGDGGEDLSRVLRLIICANDF